MSSVLEFRNICMQSTDFHFSDLDKQLCAIEQTLEKRPSRTRTVRSTSVLHKVGSDQRHVPATTTNLLQTGKEVFCSLFNMVLFSLFMDVSCRLTPRVVVSFFKPIRLQ